MFEGLESVTNSIQKNESEQQTIERDMTDDQMGDEERQAQDELVSAVEKLEVRMEDLENRIPEPPTPSSNDLQMKFLPITATLEEVISAVNELIKRSQRIG